MYVRAFGVQCQINKTSSELKPSGDCVDVTYAMFYKLVVRFTKPIYYVLLRDDRDDRDPLQTYIL